MLKVPVKLFGLIPLTVDVELTITDDMAPTTGAYAYGRRAIFCRPRYADDKGILAHEVMHIQQAWANPWHGVMYRYLDAYRLWSEVKCYREQATYYPDDRRRMFAGFIATDYRLDISEDAAFGLLCEG